MADQPLTVFEKYPGSYRLDHPDFSNVSKSPYALGVITGFYPATPDDPVTAKDVCDLTIDGQEFKEVPIFYHPPTAYADNWKLNADPSIHAFGELMSLSADWADFWKASGALVDAQDKPITDIPKDGLPFKDQAVARGIYSFSVGDEVAVMVKDGVPVAVIAFVNGVPLRPFDYVKVEMPPQIIDTMATPPVLGDPHCPYILQLSDTIRMVTPSGPNPGYSPPTGGNLGPDGFDLKLLKDAKIFPDKVAHPTPGAPTPLYFGYDYACFYGSNKVSPGNIVLDGGLWNPVPDPAFGPFWGYMHGIAADTPWADYLAAWMNTCDIVQTTQGYGGPDQPWIGAWPNGLGRPTYWLWLVDDPGNAENQSKIDYVMRTYLIEAGPMLYLVRVFYQHMTPPAGGGKVWYWKNRIAWPWNGINPPSDWSGYTSWGGYSLTQWTPPMWVNGYGPNPWPAKIQDCIPPPDGYLPGTNTQETFYSDNPHWIYAAPASKKILDDIENIVAASNAQVDVIAAIGSGTIPTPDGFRNIFGEGNARQIGNGGIIPPFGNYRELMFKVAARIGAS